MTKASSAQPPMVAMAAAGKRLGRAANRRPWGSKGLIACIALVLALAAAGCGKKTMVVPPASVVPEPITDLSCRLDERGIVLTWTMPARTAQGGKLHRVETFLLYRAVVPADKACDECPIAFGPPLEVEGGPTMVPGGERRQISFIETLLRPEHRYYYMVRSKGGWQYTSAPSNVVILSWDTPPAAPSAFTATAGDHRVVLSWQPVTELLDGRAFAIPGSPVTRPSLAVDRQPAGEVEYQVYRREEGSPPRLLDPVARTCEFTDWSVENGHDYAYQVRARRTYRDNAIGGMPTPEIRVRPQDLTPPSPLKEISVTRVGQAVTISWQRLAEPDLKAYRVYRRQTEEERARLIATVPAAILTYTDQESPADPSVAYSVTAIDDKEPPNESLPSIEVGVGQ